MRTLVFKFYLTLHYKCIKILLISEDLFFKAFANSAFKLILFYEISTFQQKILYLLRPIIVQFFLQIASQSHFLISFNKLQCDFFKRHSRLCVVLSTCFIPEKTFKQSTKNSYTKIHLTPITSISEAEMAAI